MNWSRLTLVTGPTQTAIGLEEAKAHTRVTGAHDDALITGYIRAAEARIDGPDGIGWALMSQQWKLSLDAFPSTFKLPLPGVTAVDTIAYTDTAGDAQTVASIDYRVDLGGYPARVTPVFNGTWPTPRLITGAVEITFTAGATNPGDVPEDLRQAMLLMVEHWYDERKATVTGTIIAKVPFGVEFILNERRRSAIAA